MCMLQMLGQASKRTEAWLQHLGSIDPYPVAESLCDPSPNGLAARKLRLMLLDDDGCLAALP